MLPRGCLCCLLLVLSISPRASNSETENRKTDSVYTQPADAARARTSGEIDLRRFPAANGPATEPIFGASIATKRDANLWDKLERAENLLRVNRIRANSHSIADMKKRIVKIHDEDDESLNFVSDDASVVFLNVNTGETKNQQLIATKISDHRQSVVTMEGFGVRKKSGPHFSSVTEDPIASVVMRFRREMGHTGLAVCKPFEEVDLDKYVFYSPGYPGNYPNNTDCVVVLEAGPGQLLRLDFRDNFNIEPSDGCKFDFLEIRDGAHGYSNLIGQYCGPQFPPMVTSSGRHLWLHFRSDENIEYSGFTAVFEYIQRPTSGLYQMEQTCRIDKSGDEGTISRDDVDPAIVRDAVKYGVALDCMWVINVKPGWKIQLTFQNFVLKKPNDCDSNFVDVFSDRTDLPSRLKNFCGSIADSVNSKSNILYVRFLADNSAINSTFEGLFTAFRDKEAGEPCEEDEYDCEDATCISKDLRCNGVINCRFKWDEDECENDKGSGIMQSEHIVIIMVIFSLILSGMSFAFLFKCIKKLIDDHKIIQENIRQSREADLDDLDKPLKMDRPKGGLRSVRNSGSPSDESLQVAFDIPCHVPDDTVAAELTKARSESKDSEDTSILISAHKNNKQNELLARKQNNNTQTRDHSTETIDEFDAIVEEDGQAPDTCDSACQTRESLFQTSPVHCGSERSISYGWRNVFTPVSAGRGKSSSTARNLPSSPSSGYSKDCYKAEAIIEMDSSDEKPSYEHEIRTRRPSSVATTRSAPDVIIVSAPPAR